MNKLFKILMVIAVCAALLVMVGCNNQDDVTGGEGTNQAAGNNDATQGNGQVNQDVTENPEGDPFDSTDPEGGSSAESKATEPPVGIEDPTASTEEDDFEINFDDLT